MAKRKPKAFIETCLQTANETSVAYASKKFRVAKGQIYAWRKKFPLPKTQTSTPKTILAAGKLRGCVPTKITEDEMTPTLPANDVAYDVSPEVVRMKRLEETNYLLREKISLLSRIVEIDNALLRV